jgi:hypothetical protein
LKVKTDFLNPTLKYKAVIFADGTDAHWDQNPTSYIIESIIVDCTSELTLNLASGGGVAISFTQLTQ